MDYKTSIEFIDWLLWDKEVDEKSAAIGISRNELINQMITYALANMEEPAKE